MATERAYIGLGSNIGNSLSTLRSAVAELGRLADSRFVALSSFYRTSPVGLRNQPDFVNAVAAIDTRLAPEALLAMLHAIEYRHGRVRCVPNGPRTLDLDLLLFGERVQVTPELYLPHPRAHERAFVLRPLIELAPDVDIPGHGPARRLLMSLDCQTVTRLES